MSNARPPPAPGLLPATGDSARRLLAVVAQLSPAVLRAWPGPERAPLSAEEVARLAARYLAVRGAWDSGGRLPPAPALAAPRVPEAE